MTTTTLAGVCVCVCGTVHDGDFDLPGNVEGWGALCSMGRQVAALEMNILTTVVGVAIPLAAIVAGVLLHYCACCQKRCSSGKTDDTTTLDVDATEMKGFAGEGGDGLESAQGLFDAAGVESANGEQYAESFGKNGLTVASSALKFASGVRSFSCGSCIACAPASAH